MTKERTSDTTATAEKWVAYYRVSTKRQNLGLDAQRARVQAAAAAQGAEIIAEIEEKESGRECNRKGLNRAMAEARRHGATIAVAKHDRLSRDLAFAAEMVFKSGIAFKILNLPAEAMTDKLLFAVYFGLAAQEAQLISERTKAALSALKAKGVKLGRPNAVITDEMRAAAKQKLQSKAAENPNNTAAANEIRRYFAEQTDRKARTLQATADHLNEFGYYTSRGVYHTAKSVALLCQRYGIMR